MPILILSLLAFLFPLLAFPDTAVLEVDAVGQRVALRKSYELQGWKNGEAICLNRGTQRVGCGRALMATADRLWVGMGDKTRFVMKGSMVSVSRPERGISSIAASRASSRRVDRGENNFDVALGGHLSPSYFYPVITSNVKLNERFTLGLEFDFNRYASADTTATVLGGFLNFTYYLESSVFKGWGIQFGPGYYNLGLTYFGLKESLGLFAAKTQIFWRGTAKAAFSMDFGVGVGFQWVFKQDSTLIDYDFHGFLPFAQFFVGYQF